MNTGTVETVKEEDINEEVASISQLLRDGKAFVMRNVTFVDFKRVLEERFSTGAFAIFYDVGRECGIRSCQRLMQRHPGRVGLLEAVARYKRDELWGEFRFELDKDGTGEVYVANCFEARQYGPSKQPVCYFVKGYLEGLLSQAFSRPLRATETACIAKGDRECVFQIEQKS